MDQKALLIPFNSKHEIFLQDRRGHKPPDWGFFGGGVEEGEMPLAAVIRESKEELDIDLQPQDVVELGTYEATFLKRTVKRHMFLWCTDRQTFTVLEGAGGEWLHRDIVKDRLVYNENFEAIWQRIIEVTS